MHGSIYSRLYDQLLTQYLAITSYRGRWLLCAEQAQDNRSQTIYRGGKSSVWDTRLHELEDMGIGVSLYFQFLKVGMVAVGGIAGRENNGSRWTVTAMRAILRLAYLNSEWCFVRQRLLQQQ